MTVNNENEIINVENIYQDIRSKIISAREKMIKHIDTTMTEVYWYVGKITYELYPIWSAVPTELSWSHFQELIRIDRKEEREFYEQETIKSNWGYRELNRQINTKLYDRYLISPDKKLIIEDDLVNPFRKSYKYRDCEILDLAHFLK